MAKVLMVAGLLNCGLAVAIGAFGAHGLKPRMSEPHYELLQTGVRYQMFHDLGIVILIGLALQSGGLGDIYKAS